MKEKNKSDLHILMDYQDRLFFGIQYNLLSLA